MSNEGKVDVPSKEITDFFIKRTTEHIGRVKKNIKKIVDNIEFSSHKDKMDILYRGVSHDQSKYSSEELIPYIWLTWKHKMGKDYKYPSEEIAKSVEKATKHHIITNRHHPVYFGNETSKMSDNDIIEMVADLSAMSQELGGNPSDYFEKNIQHKYNFTKNQIKTINNYFDVLGY